MRSVLLLGAAGFIGKRILRHLHVSNPELTIIAQVRSRAAYEQTLYDMDIASSPKQLNESHRLLPLEGELRCANLGISEDQIHLALNASVLIHSGEPMNLLLNEAEAEAQVVETTRQVIAFIIKMKAQGSLRHIIYLGAPISVHARRAAAPHSDEAQRLLLPYERAKLRAEEELRQACTLHGVPLSIVHPGVVVSDARTGAHEQLLGSFGLFVSYVRQGGLRALQRRGAARLPLVSADTVAAFIGALVCEAHPRSERYPLLDPAGEQRTAGQLAERIARELRVSAARSWLPHPKQRQEKVAAHSLLLAEDIDASATLQVQQRYALTSPHDEAHLSFVIADIDYRISHMTERAIPIPIISSEHTFSRPSHLPSPELPAELHYPHLNRFHSGYERGNLPIRRGRRGRLATWELNEDESKPLLILIHGIFSSADFLLPLASQLKDISIWAVDLPGYGRSPLFPFHHYVDYVIEEVTTAVRESNRKVFIAGHSSGGWIALKLLDVIPEHIEHLLLLQPVLQPPVHKFQNESIIRHALHWLRPIDYMNILISMDCYEQYHHIPHDLIRMFTKEQRSSRNRIPNAMTISHLSNMKSFAPSIHLSTNAERISVLWGYHDEWFKLPTEILPHHVTRVPNGHYMPISHPSETATWIRSRIHMFIRQKAIDEQPISLLADA